jgi:hypothetical protein
MIKNIIKKIISQLVKFLFVAKEKCTYEDKKLILLAKNLMAQDSWKKEPNFNNPKWLQDKEFRVYSQFGDDGIIHFLIYWLKLGVNNFIEFGVGSFYESNCHFLLVNNLWNGFVMDGSKDNIYKIKNSDIYWKFNLEAKQAFIDKENVNSLVASCGFDKIGYLHIDLDGNDYWILDILGISLYQPDILILEYNAIFGEKKYISIPYDPKFDRMTAHYSGKYFGASLPALDYLAKNKGYYFIGCNSAGNNAYFVKKKYQSLIPPADIKTGFQKARFREARNKKNQLQFINLDDEIKIIKGLPVINVKTGMREVFLV